MSLSKLEEVRCPCGEIFEAELWNSIDIVKDHELKEQLISGEINVVCCPHCRQIFYAEQFVLFLDTENEVIAFVYPVSFEAQRATWQSKMETDFKKAMEAFTPEDRLNYNPVLLFGLDALVSLINEFDQCSDEAIVLKYMAKDIGLSLLELHPYMARLNSLPKVLPIIKGEKKNMREDVLKGLERLIKHNDKLECYNKLYTLIRSNKNWVLKEELIKSKQKKSH